MLQKRCNDEQNDLVLLKWNCWVCCVKRAAHPAWVFVTRGCFRKQRSRCRDWREGRQVLPGSKVPGCDWDKSLVIETEKQHCNGCAAALWAPLAAGDRAGSWLQHPALVR